MERPNIINRFRNNQVFFKAPLLELTGENRILIENHQGVLAYSLNEIQVKVQYGKLAVSGNYLMIMEMNKEQLVIAGQINEIRICRR